ncbi:MAG TPA: tyrosine-type recombinase/integrase [Terriglobia bacterium]|nr:tyrosine-type recombinase/integrase [Terriglobia bacterium]
MLAEAERVEAIPTKRTPPPETRYLERDEIDKLFQSLPKRGPLVLRDRALLMLLYNTGARVQEVADLRVADVAWRARYACGSTVKETSGEAVPFGQRPCMH